MDKISIPRLYSAKLKSGGAQLRVLRNQTVQDSLRKLQNDIENIKDARKNDLAGYAIVAWSERGAVSTSVHARNDRWINTREAPDFVRSALHDVCWED